MYSDHGGGHSSSLWHLFSFISVVKKNKTKKIRTKELESRAPPLLLLLWSSRCVGWGCFEAV